MPAAVAIGGAVVGGVLSAKGAKDAANASAKGSRAAIQEQRRQYDQSRTDLAPWRTTGGNALARLDRASTGSMADFYASPDYEFRRTEGMRGLERSAAAMGGAFSGNALRGLNDLNSNRAAGEYGNWWNRQAGLATGGLSAAQATTQAGSQSAANIGAAYQNAGNAQASGIASGTNALANGLYGGLQSYLDYKAQQNRSGLQSGYGGTYYDYSGQGPGPWMS